LEKDLWFNAYYAVNDPTISPQRYKMKENITIVMENTIQLIENERNP